jgi:hypothetical protein
MHEQDMPQSHWRPQVKRLIAIAAVTIVLATLACSIARCEGSGEVYLGGFLLLRIRCAAGGYTVDQRVSALQMRANDLLELGKRTSAVTVKRSGADACIYADRTLFLTVTSADAQANGTTPESLANTWAQRLRTILPQATPEKPGVGMPGQTGGAGGNP